MKNKPYYNTFDEYVAEYPEAEHYRNWLNNWVPDRIQRGVKSANKPRAGRFHRQAIILKTEPNWCGLPGDYVWACIVPGHPEIATANHLPKVWVNDCDDGYVEKQFETLEECERQLEELKQLVPFVLSDLREFGFTS